MSGYKNVEAPTPKQEGTMDPLAFAKFVQSTGGKMLSPNG